MRETEEFYAAEGIRYMETADVPHFLQHVEDRLQQVGFLSSPPLPSPPLFVVMSIMPLKKITDT